MNVNIENFSTQQKQSFIREQDFLWMCNFINGTKLCEFDVTTHNKNNFYTINKDLLMRFGIFGQGMDLYFDVDSGKFNINGNEYLVTYRTKEGIEFNLTGYGNGLYNDIITYKDAWTDGNFTGNNKATSTIVQYNFGFKKKLVFANSVEFAFQAVCCVPYNKPGYLEFKIVPNQDLDGQVIIKRLGRLSDVIEAPLLQDNALILNWTIS